MIVCLLAPRWENGGEDEGGNGEGDGDGGDGGRQWSENTCGVSDGAGGKVGCGVGGEIVRGGSE